MAAPDTRPPLGRGAVATALALVALAALARFLFPQADPPLDLGGSGGIFSDEGALTNNARNLVLFGRAFTDEWNSYQYSPVLHLLQVPVFSLLGVGLLQERLIPMAFGTGTVLLLFVGAARAFGREAGAYASLLLATSYFTVMHNRLGLVETVQTFVMVLAFVLWQRARDGGWRWAAGAGAAAAVVVITKSLGLWFAAAFFAAALLEALLADAPGRPAALRRFLFALGTSGVVMAIWFVAVYLPNRDDILRLGAAYKSLSLPRSPARVLANLKQASALAYLRPEWALLGAALVSGALLPLRLARRETPGRADAWLLALWLLAGMAGIEALGYKPTRYFVPLGPALAGLAGWGLAALRRGPAEADPQRLSPAGLALSWAALTVVARFLPIEAAARRWTLGPFSQGRLHWLLAAAISAAILGLGILAARRGRNLPSRLAGAVRTVAVAVVLVVAVGQSARLWARWASRRDYSVLRTSRQIAPIVDGGLVAGLWAPILTLENRARVLYAFEPWFNHERTFERFPVTHFTLGDFNREQNWWWRRYPERMQDAVPLRVYRIWHTWIYFLSLREEDRGVFNRMRTDRGGPRDATLVESRAPRELEAGAAGEGRITLRNTGTAPWPEGSILAVWRGRSLGPAELPLPAGVAVRPGDTVSLAVPYLAPPAAGYYMLEWRLRDPAGAWFGDAAVEGVLVRGRGGRD